MLDLGVADDGFAVFRREHAAHGFADLVEQFVNDAVELDLNALALGGLCSAVLGLGAKADDDGIGRAGQKDIGLRDRADGAMDDIEGDFLLRNLLERRDHRFERALHITFDDRFQRGFRLGGDVGKEVFQRGALRRGELGVAEVGQALFTQEARRLFRFHHHKLVACVW